VIDVQGLSKVFGASRAVDGVSFRVPEGELLALVGASGSGKTTCLKMINRLIRPDEGRVLLAGAPNDSTPEPALRRRIGYVSQSLGLFPHMTVAGNIGVTLTLLGWNRGAIEARVRELMEQVELEPDIAERRPAGLSGGQQQRVGVARALAARPKVMLLDEPFSALDPLTRDRLQQGFHALRRKLGFTAIFVTHDMAEALLLADRIGVFQHGRLVQWGSPAELLQRPASAYVRELLDTPRRQARVFDDLCAGAGRA
jgi:osmoprotectant transport system ATP-binding protein